MAEPGDETEDLAGGIPVLPAWVCYNCGLLFPEGKPETCPCDAVGCNDVLKESDP